MNKIKKSFAARCTAVFLAVLTGTAAAAILFTIVFTLDMGLYQKSPDTVISQQAQNMQAWYSAKIFSKTEKIPHKEEAGKTISILTTLSLGSSMQTLLMILTFHRRTLIYIRTSRIPVPVRAVTRSPLWKAILPAQGLPQSFWKA